MENQTNHNIPKNRYIQLPSEILGDYTLPVSVYWIAKGPMPYFALVPVKKKWASADIVFGHTNITKNCRVKVPECLAYETYRIVRDDDYACIILG